MRSLGFEINTAQNGFLDVLLELGISGMIPTLLVFLVAFRNIFMVQGREHRELQSWSLTVMVMLLIYETDESLLLHPYYLPWFLGMVLFSELQLARRPMTSAEDSLRRSLYAMELSSAG
jgi:O-antigen ligase